MIPYFRTWERVSNLRSVATSWLDTPFMPNGRAKGFGVSCHFLVSEVYREAGFLPQGLEIPTGPAGWSNAHKESLIERHIDEQLGQWFLPVNERPAAGDLVGFRIGGCLHHIGIALGGEFVHCMRGPGVFFSSLDDATYLSRLVRVWRPVEA